MFACPNCGGNLKFNISLQQLSCENCQTQMDPYAFDSREKDAIETEEYDVTIFTCPGCGGEILSTDTSAAEFCSFCGASTILYSRISKEKRPDYIIPFKKTKEDCKNAYTKIMKKAIFAPDALKNPKYIDSFRGIYIPYWAFQMEQTGPFRFNGTKTRRRGDYIYTDHYALEGEIDAFYDGLSYDASSSFDDTISAKIAPFDIKEKEIFTPAYLSGFYADTADVDATIYKQEAEAIACNNSLRRIYNEFPGVHITSATTNGGVNTTTKAIDRTLFPVWFMSYRNGDRVAYATVNGQTGKVITDLPIDTGKYLKGSLLLAIPLFLLLNLFFTLTPSVLLIISTVLAVTSMIFLGYEVHQIKKKDGKQNTSAKYFSSGFLTALAAVVVAIAVLVLNPVSDIIYYASVLFTLTTLFITIKDLILKYNIMATRRLPQFDRTGGDDRA